MINTLALGQRAIKGVLSSNWAPEFTFKFVLTDDDDFQIKTNMIKACFLSSKVCHNLNSDPTIDSIKIEIKKVSKKMIRNFFQLIDDELKLELNASNSETYFEIAQALGTEDIIEELNKIYDSNEKLSINNAIHRLTRKMHSKQNYSAELSLCAQNLTSLVLTDSFGCFFDREKFEILREILEVYSTIAGDPQHEHSIFTYLYENFESKEFLELASYLHLKLLHGEDISYMMQRLSEDNICSQTIQALKIFFGSETNQLMTTSSKCTKVVRMMPFTGIFDKLRNDYGGNPEKTKVIEIITTDSSRFPVSNALNYNDKTCFYNKMKSIEHTYIIFNFKSFKVSISGYELKTRIANQRYNFPKSWLIQGSNDMHSWTTLDQKNHCYDLEGANKSKYFQVKMNQQEKFQYIKYQQLSNFGGYNEQNQISLAAIEFYGNIY
ncbi:hypothetical protein TRFO_09055 [Tritrichomonas foetus]|uniref:BACK domain-containing protein n=1 Tax=Tritrichomonas foetus TaxID=1144522 RepID=A0A1J4JHI6_9EUKA|nr:hypothetical protein TRFO_09055 [Tritrichomonas foetus]|eukprot:OHS98185.1 hypothetical protein TRFO_09055 [Tritrichomonas foetus]